MGGVGNGATEEDWCWDLNPGMAAMPGEDHVALAEWGLIGLGQSQDNMALGCAFLPRGLGSGRDLAGKERDERTLASGP